MSHSIASQTLADAHREHQAGRLSAAEAIYRRIIADDPNHAEALHWLGVLAHQAGRDDDAVSLISRAIELCPDDPAYACNYGEVCVALGRHDEAAAAFGRAVVLQPDRPETHFSLGLALQRTGKTEPAVNAFCEAVRLNPTFVDAFYGLGNAMLAAGRADEALDALNEVVRLNSAHVQAFVALGVAHAKLEQWFDAEENLRRALDLEPENARAFQNLAAVHAARGFNQSAKTLLEKTIKMDPHRAGAYSGLAAIASVECGPLAAMPLFKQAVAAARAKERQVAFDRWSPPGELSDAIAAKEARLRLGPELEAFQFLIARGDGVGAPPAAPAPGVARHFDKYADEFDGHLRDKLNYRGPEALRDALLPHLKSGAKLDILDLGCGTGLMGEALGPMKRLLYGVDLSPKMLALAKQRRVYDALEEGEVAQALEECQPTFDLIVACDVFVYIGDLARVFRATPPVLRPGGLFAFTVEAQDTGTYKLMPTGRYVHSEAYLRALANDADLEIVTLESQITRTERGQGVRCWIAVLRARVS